MGDYRNELQSALAQVEALRAENVSLRMKLRGAKAPDADAADDAPEAASLPPAVARRPRGRSHARGALAAASGAVLALGATLVAVRARSRPPPEPERLALPYVPPPAAPDTAAPAPLPMPPTRVTLPERKPPAGVVEDVAEDVTVEPSAVTPSPMDVTRSLRWPADSPRDGLLVLSTVPDAECSVGGVRFTTPRPVFLGEGTYPVRCVAGSARHVWQVRIAARRVTFDTLHRVGAR